MATQNVCRYHKFGFCKYTEKWRFPYVKEECENKECEVRSCNLRHPEICSYYRDYRRCKFGEWCSFKHVEKTEINKDVFEKLDRLEKLVKEKNSIIDILENKIKVIEEKLFINTDSTNEITEKESCEIEVKRVTVDIFKCDECGFESNSKKGLHIHTKKKHAKKFNCDVCDKVFDSETEGKIHRKTHSFRSRFVNTELEEQTCENCDFKCPSIYTMEVHIGKCSTDNLECGFCDSKFVSLSNLELHLRTCEVYECNECWKKGIHLHEIKKHVKEDHENCKFINHLKIDLEDETTVIAKIFNISEL